MTREQYEQARAEIWNRHEFWNQTVSATLARGASRRELRVCQNTRDRVSDELIQLDEFAKTLGYVIERS